MIMFSHLARVRASNTARANLFCAGDRPRDINDGGSQKFRVRFEPRTVRLRAHFFVPQAVPSVPQTRVYRGILRVPPITGIGGTLEIGRKSGVFQRLGNALGNKNSVPTGVRARARNSAPTALRPAGRSSHPKPPMSAVPPASRDRLIELAKGSFATVGAILEKL
jgi:hypothetical protein